MVMVVIVVVLVLLLLSREARVNATKKSLQSFEWLLSFAPQHLSHFHCGPEVFDEELKMVKDMVSMLPDKINQMHYQARSFN